MWSVRGPTSSIASSRKQWRPQAGLAQVIVATVPLLTLLLAITHGQERLRLNRLVGALLAIGGVALIFGERVAGGTAPVPSLLAILAAALCISEGIVIVKAFPRLPVPTLNAIAMGTGAAFLFAISLAAHESWRLPQRGTTLAALVYLIGLGSAAVFALFVFVVRRWPASAAAYQFVLFPIATVLLSSWLDHEAVTIALLAGGYSLLPACMSERWPAPPGSNRSSDVSLAQMVPGPPQLTPVPTRWKPSSRCHDGVTISGCLRRSGRGGRSHMQTDLSVPRRR